MYICDIVQSCDICHSIICKFNQKRGQSPQGSLCSCNKQQKFYSLPKRCNNCCCYPLPTLATYRSLSIQSFIDREITNTINYCYQIVELSAFSGCQSHLQTGMETRGQCRLNREIRFLMLQRTMILMSKVCDF